MARADLGYLDYVKAAYHLKVPIGPLGALPVNKLLLAGFGILGIANPGFWLLGVAYEAGYLLYLPGSDRFQKVVAGQQLLERRGGASEPTPSTPLSAESQERYDTLRAACSRVLSPVGTLERPGSALDELHVSRMNDLLSVFAKLLTTRERLTGTLELTSEQGLTADLRALEKKIAAEAEGSVLRHSLEQSLEIQKRRIDNLRRAGENLRIVDAELERIERQIALLVEENHTGTDPAAFSARLDTVSSSLEETNRWMSANADLLSSFESGSAPGPRARASE